MEQKPKILAVAGPTASGKSALAVRLSKRFGGEVISCDSMQIYRGMDVGTAKPTPEETAGVPHHLIDVADPFEPFSCADFVRLAGEKISDLLARGKLPVVCGGTGLYLDRLLCGGVPEESVSDPELRRELFAFAEQNGNHALHEKLAAVDPESAAAIHENNVKRVVRALEILELTGRTKSDADRQTRERNSPYDATVLCLCASDRDLLNRRIDLRVDEMLRAGLIEETRRLRDAGVFRSNSTAAQAIGYKELLPYLDGDISEEEAVARLKTATHQYAKRQMTWFRAKDYVRWIDVTPGGRMLSADEVEAAALALLGG